MPGLIHLHLVGNGWPWTDDAHIPSQYVLQLRDLINAASSEEFPELGDPGIMDELTRMILFLLNFNHATMIILDEGLSVITMGLRAGTLVHGAEFVEGKGHKLWRGCCVWVPVLFPDAFLFVNNRSGRVQFYQQGDEKYEWE